MKDKIIRIVLVLVGLGVIGWCIYAGFQVGKNRQATLTIGQDTSGIHLGRKLRNAHCATRQENRADASR